MPTSGGPIYSAPEGGTGQFRVSCLVVNPCTNLCIDTALSIHVLYIHCGRAVGPEKQV